MIIRNSTINDLKSIVNIYNEIIDEGGFTADLDKFSIEQKINWFETCNKFPYGIFIAEMNDNTIGYCYLSPWRNGRRALSDVAEISFYLKKEYRNKGFGSKIIKSCIEKAKINGFSNLLAILLGTNLVSKTLLEKNNFKIVGHLENIAKLNDKRCGQLIMFLNLKQ